MLRIAMITLLMYASSLFAQGTMSNDEKKITALVAKFNDRDPFEQGKAIAELAKMGETVGKYLVESLQDRNEKVRWCSAIALEKMAPKAKAAIPFLIKALKDSSAHVRWCSALALGKYKTKARSAAADLSRLLYDSDREVRWAAYQALDGIDPNTITKAPDATETITKIEQMLPLLMKELKVPGVSACLAYNNAIVWNKSYGVSDIASGHQVDSSSVFEACSMSKPVFAYLVLKLADQRKIELDKPLYKYLPEEFVSIGPDYAQQITARMVLAHTSGLPNWRKGGEERDGPLPVLFKPGLKFNYSGEGIYYSQRVVEQITHESLQDFAKHVLFDPLGLVSTSYVWTEKLDKQIVTGYNGNGKALDKGHYRVANAAYTLYTTPQEYARLMIAILGPGASLSAEMKKEMLAHQVRVDSRDVIDRPGRHLGLLAYRGLGWAIDETITRDVVYHSGANQTGFRCYAQYCPVDGTGVVIMTNSVNGSELWQRLIGDIGDF